MYDSISGYLINSHKRERRINLEMRLLLLLFLFFTSTMMLVSGCIRTRTPINCDKVEWSAWSRWGECLKCIGITVHFPGNTTVEVWHGRQIRERNKHHKNKCFGHYHGQAQCCDSDPFDLIPECTCTLADGCTYECEDSWCKGIDLL